MPGIRVSSTEALLALEKALGLSSTVVEEALSTAEHRATTITAQLDAQQASCQQQVSYWAGRIADAGKDEDTSDYRERLDACRRQLSRVRDAQARVENALGDLRRLGRPLQVLVTESTPKARAFLRQRVLEIEEYVALKPGGQVSMGSGGAGSSAQSAVDPSTVRGTGYRRPEVDDRDWLWVDLYGATPDGLPERLSLESFLGPAEDQGDRPHCVCYALAALKHHDEVRDTGRWLCFPPEPIYLHCKASPGEPKVDGTTIRQAFKVAAHKGLAADDGQRYLVKGYARLQSVDEMRHALSLRKVVMLGAGISPPWSTLEPGALVPLEARGDDGHCMLVVGYDDDRRMLRVRNSWGADWADTGHCWLPYEYLEAESRLDAWTTVCETASAVSPGAAPDSSAPPTREVWPTSNFAWFNPNDLRLEGEDGPDLEWSGIPQDVADRSLRLMESMRPFLDLAHVRQGDLDAVGEKLSRATDPAGRRLFSEPDVDLVRLYLGNDAIRIDLDCEGEFMAINGRHRLYMAQQLGIASVPVSISNGARRKVQRIVEGEQ